MAKDKKDNGKVGKNLGLAISKNERRAMTNKANSKMMANPKGLGVLHHLGMAASEKIDKKERAASKGDIDRMNKGYKKDIAKPKK